MVVDTANFTLDIYNQALVLTVVDPHDNGTSSMSVMLETSLGDIIIDLEVERCPKTCENFLKLCKIKYYALNAFFNGQLLRPTLHEH